MHLDEVKAKVHHLRSLEKSPGSLPEGQIVISPVDLAMQRNKTRGVKLMRAIGTIARLRLATSRKIIGSAISNAKKQSEAKRKLVSCMRAIARLRLASGHAEAEVKSTVSDGNLEDLDSCMEACESMEHDMEDFGMDSAVCKPDPREVEVVEDIAMQPGGDPSSYLQPVTDALAAEARAVDLAREGKTTDALQKYTECKKSLATALVVLRAAAKFKAAVAVDFEADESKLHAFEEHVGEMVQKLEDHPNTPAGDSFWVGIHPEELSMDEYTDNLGLTIACASLGAAIGILTLGPFSGLAAGVGAAVASRSEGEIGDTVRAAGQAPLDVGSSMFGFLCCARARPSRPGSDDFDN